nr:NUDIX domain-containing protein [Halobacterium sp. R2-5]
MTESVHLLSSFVAVVADGQVLLGVKPPQADRGPFLSFPGSGYLDRNHDFRDGDAEPTRAIVGRELQEELGVMADGNRVRCLGVFEDTSPESHLNPALFSVVYVDESASSVLRTARRAPDADEFTEFVFVPLTEAALDGLVELAVDGTATAAPERVPTERFDGMSHKSLLMVLLLGRREVGEEWFDRTLSEYSEIVLEPA